MQKMRDWMDRIPLKRRGVMITFMIVLMSVALMSSVLGVSTSDVLSRQITDTRASLADFTAETIELRFKDALRVANMALSQDIITKAMENVSEAREYPMAQQISDERNIGAFLKSMENSTNFVRIRLLLCGDCLYSNEQINFFRMSDEQRNALDEMRANGQYYDISEGIFPYIFNQDRRVVTVTYPKASRGSFMNVDGAVAVDIDTAEIERIIENMIVTPGDAVVLVNRNGEAAITMGDARNAALIQEPVRMGEWTNLSEKGLMVYEVPISIGSWRLSYRVRTQSMYSQVNDFLRNMLTAIALVLMLALIITITTTAANNRRILQLSETMDKVRSGDMNLRVREGGSNEIGVMEHSFNYLMDTLNAMVETKLENARQISRLEMRLLQSQIKPHFLYNSLDLICWRLLKMGDESGARYVQALAQFYRIGLSRGSELIPLEDELRHVQLYVEIQNFRLDGAIDLNIKMPAHCRSIKVPGNILQPLVENSINAGIMEKAEHRGHILICCQLTGQMLEILISDDGVGMDMDMMESLLKNGSDAHYGVWNVHRRLRLQFGDSAGLEYSLRSEGGVDVRVKIPCAAAPDAVPPSASDSEISEENDK